MFGSMHPRPRLTAAVLLAAVAGCGGGHPSGRPVNVLDDPAPISELL